MKKTVIIMILFTFIPAIAFGSNPAPYTEDAWKKIISAGTVTPKVQGESKLSREESLEKLMDYYSEMFKKAGYNFNDTVSKIINDLKNDPDSIPRDRQTVYNNLYILLHLMLFECENSKIDIAQFFPSDMKESLHWLKENSEFSKHENPLHHGIKK